MLVVIAILLLLLALLLPALQRVRESANKVVCGDNLRKIGKAIHLYMANNNQYFPTGGGNNPMPRTLTRNGIPATKLDQDWGWMYQILPYLEQESLWKFRSNNPLITYPQYSWLSYDPEGDRTIQSTPIPIYFCPSRRAPEIIETAEAGRRAMNDYAGNIGCFTFYNEQGVLHSPCADQPDDGAKTGTPFRNGIFIKSQYPGPQKFDKLDSLIHPRDVIDGMANTLLVSEKRMKSNFYGKQQFGDYDGYVAGFIPDTLRAGQLPPALDFETEVDGATDRFGSAHPRSINVLFADNSVRQVTYNIGDHLQLCKVYHPWLGVYWGVTDQPPGSKMFPLTLFQRLCHRADGGTVDLNMLEE
jgi:prepilin-type processing-associated H-X9-DG protein